MLCYTATRDCLPIPPKKNPPCIPPAPSCTAETKSGKKGISRGFVNPSSRKVASQNFVRISFRHLPETLRAEHQRKMSFPFSRKISPPPYQRSKEHFSSVLPSEARQWRNDSFHIGILLEKSSDFVQETQQNLWKRRQSNLETF